MEPILIIILVAAGIIVGLGQGLLGVGGAFIMVPVMVAVFDHLGWDQDIAVKMAFGTSLLVIFPAAVATTVAHHRRKSYLVEGGHRHGHSRSGRLTVGVYADHAGHRRGGHEDRLWRGGHSGQHPSPDGEARGISRGSPGEAASLGSLRLSS